MKRILYGILVVLIASTALNAITITTKHPACISKELLDEFYTAASNKDNRQMFMLIAQSKCFVLEPGQEVSIIDRGIVRVWLRLYYEDGTFKVVAPIEAIQ